MAYFVVQNEIGFMNRRLNDINCHMKKQKPETHTVRIRTDAVVQRTT